MGAHAEDDPRRRVPRTDAVLADPRLQEAVARVGRGLVLESVRRAQERVRTLDLEPVSVADEAVAQLPATATTLRPVVNATGVVVHTNLGRAPLSDAAVAAIGAAAGYVDIELDLADGRRSGRAPGCRAAMLAAVPAAQAAFAVNNGAAALVLATTALAAGREVVVSRGELVEIGAGFRLPELIESAGARLREVGTTNRTSARDYADAIGPETGCILKVHPSNFSMAGFTSAVGVAELAALGVPLVHDVGSGLLTPHSLVPDEPDVTTSLEAGAALVTCSGDKLLGGPQAGLLFGRREIVERLQRHPLARAVRLDKLVLAALEATLRGPRPPVWEAIEADPETLRRRCAGIVADLPQEIGARIVTSVGVVGGGGAPGVTLTGWAVSLPTDFADHLRLGAQPVLTRVEKGRCLLDLRCVPAELDPVVTRSIVRALQDQDQG
jgi:L-seryl-tRNA(Ser) seleniumtransferase